jgi:hypothetical protein
MTLASKFEVFTSSSQLNEEHGAFVAKKPPAGNLCFLQIINYLCQEIEEIDHLLDRGQSLRSVSGLFG